MNRSPRSLTSIAMLGLGALALVGCGGGDSRPQADLAASRITTN